MRKSVLLGFFALVVSVSDSPLAAPQPSDWPMFGHDLFRSFANPTSNLTPATVGRLQPAWFFPSDDLFNAQASAVEGVVYVGGWDGYFYALDQNTGQLRWKFAVDCQNAIIPIPKQCLPPGQPAPERQISDGGLITSSAAVVDGKVYFGGGRTLYALNAASGKLVWKHVVCGRPEDTGCRSDPTDSSRIFSSPAVADGKVYFGLSADGVAGYRGGFLAVDATTGKLIWRFEVDPKLDKKTGRPVLNSAGLPVADENRGCGNVWSSPTVDMRQQLVVFGTANCPASQQAYFRNSVLALDAKSGRLRWAFSPRAGDIKDCDFDFGSTANRIRYRFNTYFGIGGKDGSYYLLRAASARPDGDPLWRQSLVFGGEAGGFYGGAAFDGRRIYQASAIGDFGELAPCDPSDPRDLPFQEPSSHALELTGGRIAWQGTLSQTFAATTAGAGVIFNTYPGSFDPTNPTAGGFPPELRMTDAASGRRLVSLPLPGTTNAPATPLLNMVIVPMGNVQDGQGGGVMAYRIAP